MLPIPVVTAKLASHAVKQKFYTKSFVDEKRENNDVVVVEAFEQNSKSLRNVTHSFTKFLLDNLSEAFWFFNQFLLKHKKVKVTLSEILN